MHLFNLISTISTCFYKRCKIHWFLSGVNWNHVVWYSLHQDVAHLSLPPLSGCFESFSYSGQSEVRSGTMTTCWVVNANMDQSGDPGNQYCMTKHGYHGSKYDFLARKLCKVMSVQHNKFYTNSKKTIYFNLHYLTTPIKNSQSSSSSPMEHL